MISYKNLAFYSLIILFLLLSVVSCKVVNVPLADPFFVVAGKPTTVKISVYISHSVPYPSSVILQELEGYGKPVVDLGALNDKGMDGDEIAGDRVYTITKVFDEDSKELLKLRVSAHFKYPRRIRRGWIFHDYWVMTTIKQVEDFYIPIVRLPSIADFGQYNQAVDNVVSIMVNTRNHFILLTDQSLSLNQFSQSLNNSKDSLLTAYSNLEAIYRFETHSPSNFPRWAEYEPTYGSLVQKIHKVRDEEEMFINNGRDPRVQKIADWVIETGCLDENQLESYGSTEDRKLCFNQYQKYSKDSTFQEGVLKESSKIIVKKEIGQFTNLIGKGIGQIYDLGQLTVKGINIGINKLIDIFLQEETGELGLIVAEVQDGEILELPSGDHDIIFSFGGPQERAVVRSVPINLDLSLAINPSPGEVEQYKNSCSQLLANLISWWPGDGNAFDIKDNNHAALMNGATFGQGLVGQAFSLDGIDDYVDLGTGANLNISTNDLTVSFWVKFRNNNGEQVMMEKFIEKFNSGRTGWTFTKITGNVIRLHLANTQYSFWNAIDVIPETISTNTWIHAAFTRIGDTFTVYWNGIALGSATFPGVNLDTDASLKVGHRGNPNDPRPSISIGSQDIRNFYLNGLIDEIEIFNRGLSVSEIERIYNTGSAGLCKE